MAKIRWSDYEPSIRKLSKEGVGSVDIAKTLGLDYNGLRSFMSRKGIQKGGSRKPTKQKTKARGSAPANEWKRCVHLELYRQQKGYCADHKCGHYRKDRQMHIDHILPRKHKGKTIFENLRLICGNCNQIKKDKIR